MALAKTIRYKNHRNRALRITIVAFLIVAIPGSLHVVYHPIMSDLIDTLTVLHTTAAVQPHIATRERILRLASENRDLVYLPTSNIMFITMAKGGTTSTWNWLYRGVTGRPRFNMTQCKTYVQDVRCECWGKEANYLYEMSESEQWRILKSAGTLRVAIQRDPYDRLLSSFKSKFTCEHEKYGTDLKNRATMVPTLRRQAGFPIGKPCMNVSEFADALESCRVNAGAKGFKLKKLRNMDVHVRPQDFFFDDIDYDIILDVKEMHVKNLLPVIQRLKYSQLVEKGIEHRHASSGSELLIPEKTAKKLHAFALESKVGKSKYPLSV